VAVLGARDQPGLQDGLEQPDPLDRLCGIAARLGITVVDSPPDRCVWSAATGWPPGSVAAYVSSGEYIALNSSLDDVGLRTDVLAMAVIVAAVMGACDIGHPCAITAPDGIVLISRSRLPRPARGPGELATLLARSCGRQTASAAFRYAVPAIASGPPVGSHRAALRRCAHPDP
jgi:hypothetical protein